MCPISKMELEDLEDGIFQCLNLLDFAKRDDIPKKWKDTCLELTALGLQLAKNILDGLLNTAKPNGQTEPTVG